MENSPIRLSVWTEGLDEDWGLAPDNRGRLERGKMSPKGVAQVVHQIQDLNGTRADCLFILEADRRRLHLNLNSGILEISDPGNMNYQNVTLGNTDLELYLLERFAPQQQQQLQADPRTLRWMEGIIAAMAGVGLVWALFYLSDFLNRDSQFMPKPVALEIDDPVASKDILFRHSGIYVTRVADGEMVIEVSPDGSWGYYDMYKGQPGYYQLEPVNVGNCRPVFEDQEVAILTDTRFMFYPQEGKLLVFLERSFKRIGQNRDELPYFLFPQASGSIAKLQ
jgi:hypothetical protein